MRRIARGLIVAGAVTLAGMVQADAQGRNAGTGGVGQTGGTAGVGRSSGSVYAPNVGTTPNAGVATPGSAGQTYPSQNPFANPLQQPLPPATSTVNPQRNTTTVPLPR